MKGSTGWAVACITLSLLTTATETTFAAVNCDVFSPGQPERWACEESNKQTPSLLFSYGWSIEPNSLAEFEDPGIPGIEYDHFRLVNCSSFSFTSSGIEVSSESCTSRP